MSFSISSWNIQGLYSTTFGDKTSDPEFVKSVNNLDIIIIHETWNYSDLLSNCPNNYIEFSVPSVKKKNVKNGRDSGGTLIWHKAQYKNDISPVKKGKTHLWIKINRGIVNSTRDIYMCNLYPTFKLPLLH